MRKRVLHAVLLLAAGGILLTPVPSGAQDTIGIYADFGEGLAPSVIIKPGTPFDVVVELQANHGSSAIEFVMTELMHLYPGVFKLNTTKVNNTPLDLGNNQNGEYLLAFMDCVPAGPAEMVRVRYYDLDGDIGENTVLQLRGLLPGDSMPTSFGGEMGYVSCMDEMVVVHGAPWNMASGLDPTVIPGVESTDGMVVLNPTGIGVPTEETSVGMLKSRF